MTDPHLLLTEVMSAINSYDPLIFTDQHRALFERANAALAGEVTVEVREEWAAKSGPYVCGPQPESWTWEMHGRHSLDDEHGPWLAHRHTVTTYTSPWTPVEEGEQT